MPTLPVGGANTDLQLGNRDPLPSSGGFLLFGFRYGLFSTLAGSKKSETNVGGQRLISQMSVLSAKRFLDKGWWATANLPIGRIEHQKDEAPADERVAGFGDLELAVGHDLARWWGPGLRRPNVAIELGVRLPTGAEAQTAGVVVPPTLLSIGRGTFAVAPRITTTMFVLPRVAVAARASYTKPLGRSPRGLLYGDSFGYSADATWLVSSGWTATAGVSGALVQRADEEPHGAVLNSGGHFLVAQAGAGVRLGERMSLLLNARMPLVRQPRGAQLTETFTVGAVLAWRLPQSKDDDDKDGEDKDGADRKDSKQGGDKAEKSGSERAADAKVTAPKGDVKDAATRGASFRVADTVVIGKLTVVDYWADWCSTCKKLSKDLAVVAAADPRLAVRKVEVPDFDKPVAKEHLQGVDRLPVVDIYKPDGTLLKRMKETTRASIVAEVKALLKGLPPKP